MHISLIELLPPSLKSYSTTVEIEHETVSKETVKGKSFECDKMSKNLCVDKESMAEFSSIWLLIMNPPPNVVVYNCS